MKERLIYISVYIHTYIYMCLDKDIYTQAYIDMDIDIGLRVKGYG